jgi:hypothetical protein
MWLSTGLPYERRPGGSRVRTASEVGRVRTRSRKPNPAAERHTPPRGADRGNHVMARMKCRNALPTPGSGSVAPRLEIRRVLRTHSAGDTPLAVHRLGLSRRHNPWAARICQRARRCWLDASESTTIKAECPVTWVCTHEVQSDTIGRRIVWALPSGWGDLRVM